MSEDESPGERAANHTWGIMSAIGGGLVVFFFFPESLENPFAPLVVAAFAAIVIGGTVELVTWLWRRRGP